ncbi:MAG: right-handed parallel beta-helix repeat-containing protein [Candidatus Thorarchaeota archaeon]|nr:right-handed parallel beta-helix repeat-containing protein [Candidatus Thorarchaeota archaeon]
MRADGKIKIALLLAIVLAVGVLGNPVISSNIEPQLLEDQNGFSTAYTPHAAIIIHSNTEMVARATTESWPGDGSAGNPYVITGYYFYDTTHSLEIYDTSLYWVFTGNEVNGSGDPTVWCGIAIDNATNGIISNNLFHNRYRGVWLDDVTNVNITGNIIQNNHLHGIECVGFINGCLISENTVTRCEGAGIRSVIATDCIISDNVIYENDLSGIQVVGSSTRCEINNNEINLMGSMGIQLGPSTSVSIKHNQISNTSGAGMYLQGSDGIEIYNNTIEHCDDDGMKLTTCERGLVHENTITSCDGIGIYIVSGENSTFKLNHIEGVTEYGIKTGVAAMNMTITRNAFINNGGTAQVYDDGENNVYIYNYYDDWTSPDVDADQIVDVPYVMDGDADNEDPYPLTESPTGTNPSGGESFSIPIDVLLIVSGGVALVIVMVVLVKKRC